MSQNQSRTRNLVSRDLGTFLAKCHPNRKHYAKGLCGLCWRRQYYSTPDQRAKKKVRHDKYYAEHREQINATTFKAMVRRIYGLTMDEYRKIMAKPCAICGGKSKHLDHDHKTKMVRGALCVTCNIGLGGFKDAPGLLRKAAAYIKNGQ